MVAAVISTNPLQLDVRSHKRCLFICCIVTLASFQYGLDYGLVGGFMAMPGFLKVYGYYDEEQAKWAIDPTVQQLISSLMTIGTFVGSLLVGPFSSKFGRRIGLWAASLINLVSTAIMIGTTNLGALYFARFILGKNYLCNRPVRRSQGRRPAKTNDPKVSPSAGSSPSPRFTSTK